ncbi:hypothetical protein RM844_16460 [Streptomyces sp. DSM 44915]|uniref:Secreted protein n=1 Tax=Streptomyces chisholmiae TaxID=3075540 RepID=A0ABU2JTP5_9ACTN|nr:hypothetical protein [Streptomyces sp. DSM 44915]MDT0267874.1 hypothetical protein [Streptomyces sp. DSM 44915]
MPHPTAAQLVYGSVTVVSLTLLALFVAPELPGPAALLVAAGALAAGTAVALRFGAGRRAGRPDAAPAAPAEPDDRPAGTAPATPRRTPADRRRVQVRA